jgi:hypothetical protein
MLEYLQPVDVCLHVLDQFGIQLPHIIHLRLSHILPWHIIHPACPIFTRQQNLLYFAGYLTTQTYQATRLLMQQLRLLHTGPWHPVKLSAVICTLFYPYGKMNDLILSNKLCMVKPSMEMWYSFFSDIRKEEVMLTNTFGSATRA